ncbi:MAG: 3-deoxy-D-manno-octulosonic acid transferase [Minwuia sp.]|nr:3-deoxy-D-manno-octulosonic acid transferase [Minwuia sp.]
MVGQAVYGGVGALLAPLAPTLLRHRLKHGKEDPARTGERLGHPGLARPAGPLIWIHGASVGEAQSVLALIARLRAERPDISILVTTGTVSSANLLQDRLPDGAFHQFVPLDLPAATARFIAHWRPDAAFWVESELWPGLIRAMDETGKPLILLNGRMSARSFGRWKLARPVISALLRRFALILTQSAEHSERFRALGAGNVVEAGNLKHAAVALTVDDAELARLQCCIGDRPVWLAASVHPGEEQALADAHRHLLQGHAGALLIAVPRHPARAAEMARAFTSQGMAVTFRSRGEDPDAECSVHFADTMGELGLFYRLAPLAVIGGSFIPHGGQNLLEAARLGVVPLCGPSMENFRAVAEEMQDAGAMIRVDGATMLPGTIKRLLTTPEELAEARLRCLEATAAHDGVLPRVLAEIAPYLPQELS